MSNPQMLDQEIDKELLQNGIKENANIELESNLNQLIHILGSDSIYDKIKEEFETIAKNIKAVIGNENKMIKLYKESKRKFYELNNHCIKLTNSLSEVQNSNYEPSRKVKEKEPPNVKEEKREPAKAEVVLIPDKPKDDIVDEGEIEQLNKEKLTLKIQLEQAINNAEKIEREKADLVYMKDGLERSYKILKDENSSLKDKLSTLGRNLEVTEKKVSEWHEKYDNIKSYSDDRVKDIDKLKQSNENLAKSYDDQCQKNIDKKNIIDSLSSDKYRLEKNLGVIRAVSLILKSLGKWRLKRHTCFNKRKREKSPGECKEA